MRRHQINIASGLGSWIRRIAPRPADGICRAGRLLTLLLVLAGGGRAAAGTAAISELPASGPPDFPFAVRITVTVDESVFIYAVEDQVPAGWSASGINNNGVFDPSAGKVKWGPFFDHVNRVLSYNAILSSGAAGVCQFNGLAVFNDRAVAISGQRQITVLTASQASQVICSGPECYRPGLSLSLTNQAIPAPGVAVYAVEDQIPEGWSASQISHGGAFDGVARKIRWGPFADHTTRLLTCQLLPPVNQTGSVSFSGSGSFDNTMVAIQGIRILPVATNSVISALPTEFQLQTPFQVSLTVTPQTRVRIQSIEDTVPPYCQITQINESGVFDSQAGTVKWGPFYDHTPRVLTYQVTSATTASNQLVFSGCGVFDGTAVSIAGQRQSSRIECSVVCSMPSEFLPGVRFTLTNQVVVDSTIRLYAVEDSVPADWSATAISHDGSFDPATHRIKWGPFYDHTNRTLTWQLRPPSTAHGTNLFIGQAAFNDRTVPITGQRQISEIPLDRANTILRSLPELTRTGRTITVTNAVHVAPNVTVYAVEDTLPDGWVAVAISDGGQFDANFRKIKWGPFYDAQSRNLTVQLKITTNSPRLAAFAGVGSFNAALVSISGPQTITVLANHLPVTRDDLVVRNQGQSVSIPIARLLANDSDADDDPLTIISVPAASVQGVPVVLADGFVTYTPAIHFNLPDDFAYTVSDGYGGVATATVSIKLAAGSILWWSSQRMGLHFVGVPGQTYEIQATDGLTPPHWSAIGSGVASDDGGFDFEDASIVAHPTRFYRSAIP